MLASPEFRTGERVVRIALISDLHANRLALEAVLIDIDHIGVDRIICLGDVATLGPEPGWMIDALRELGCSCIMGNHDDFLLDAELIHQYTEAPIVVDAVDWCRDQLSGDQLDFLRNFRSQMELSLGDEGSLLLFHGTPRSHMEDLLVDTPAAEVDEMLAGHRATVMAGGHTHVQMLRQHRGILLVNPGSLGAPFREYTGGAAPTILPHAEYAIVEYSRGTVRVQLQRLPLDRAELRRAAQASDNPLAPSLVQQYA